MIVGHSEIECRWKILGAWHRDTVYSDWYDSDFLMGQSQCNLLPVYVVRAIESSEAGTHL